MKIWICCVRFGLKVLSLKVVWFKMDGWLKVIGRKLLNVFFYKLVFIVVKVYVCIKYIRIEFICFKCIFV